MNPAMQASAAVGGRSVAHRAAGRPILQKALPTALGQHLRLPGQLLAGLVDLGEQTRVAHRGGQLRRQKRVDAQIFAVQPL